MGGVLLPTGGERPRKAGIMSPQAVVYGLIGIRGRAKEGVEKICPFVSFFLQMRPSGPFQLSPLSIPDAENC